MTVGLLYARATAFILLQIVIIYRTGTTQTCPLAAVHIAAGFFGFFVCAPRMPRLASVLFGRETPAGNVV